MRDSFSRRRALQGLRMRHCCEHAVDSALPEVVFDGGEACRQHLDALLEVDALAARISCEFAEVLTRYDCTQSYSIKFHCEDCKVNTYTLTHHHTPPITIQSIQYP